jgi:hypothetical protein
VKALEPMRARELRFVLGIRVTVRRLEQVGQKRSILLLGIYTYICQRRGGFVGGEDWGICGKFWRRAEVVDWTLVERTHGVVGEV